MNWRAFYSEVLRQMGRPIPGKKTYRFYLIIFLHLLCIFQLVLGLQPRWKILKARFQSIEDILVLSFLSMLVFEIGWSPNKIASMMKITKQELFVREKSITELANLIINKNNERKDYSFSSFYYMCLIFSIVNGLIPFASGLYFIQNVDVSNTLQEEIPMPLECWHPINIHDSLTYIIFVSPQILFYIFAMHEGFCWFSIIICSLVNLEKEVDLLCLSIKEIDRLADYDELSSDAYSNNYDERQERLRSTLSNIIIHHQKIIRNTKKLNEASNFLILLLNYVTCGQICAILYAFFESEETISRVKYMFLIIPVFGCIFYFCWNGQQLTNKSEEIYRTMAECPWINKPQWFKKDLQLMMMCASRPLQIRMYGFYELNLKNLMTICQAAYSYFSLMHRMQVKQNSLNQ